MQFVSFANSPIPHWNFYFLQKRLYYKRIFLLYKPIQTRYKRSVCENEQNYMKSRISLFFHPNPHRSSNFSQKQYSTNDNFYTGFERWSKKVSNFKFGDSGLVNVPEKVAYPWCILSASLYYHMFFNSSIR